MQIIVLGMHRSGTSMVARLLNMMGAYFSPDDVAMQASKANPKGHWEREDIRILNDDILQSLGISWDNINDFEPSLLTETICEEFAPRIQKIIFNLDSHRPWMIKDPRLCLLLPVWEQVLEVPICIHVYRNPIQVAQSLKTREKILSVNEGATLNNTFLADYSNNAIDFPVVLGMALWEKYTLNTLAYSKSIPRILMSIHDLIANPVKTVKALYKDLLIHEIQGLRLPSDKEILAFIEPKLFHERGNNQLQRNYINTQQTKLVKAFQKGNIFELEPLPDLSIGASEILKEYQNKLLAANKIVKDKKELTEYSATTNKQKLHIKHLEKLVEKLTLDLHNAETAQQNEQQAKLNFQRQNKVYQGQWNIAEQKNSELEQQLQALNNSILEKETTLTQQEQQISELNQQISEQTQQISTLTQQLRQQNQNVNELTHWVFALNEDINSAFNSLTWRSGRLFTKAALILMFKKEGLTSEDHIKEIMAQVQIWKTTNDSFQVSNPTQLPIAQTTPALLTTIKQAIQHDSRDYSLWIKSYDILTSKDIKIMQQHIEQWDNLPLISIVMPTYNTSEKCLREAIESVQQQIYPHWELCIADDASTDSQIKTILEEYATKDQRIKLKLREENGHISAASNTALEQVTGDFITFLDHDDVLTKHALFWVVQAIIDNPQAKLLYSDEDKLNELGERCDPYFKPDWNPDLFLSHNYITHLLVYSADLVKQVNGFREGFEGAQDYDLALRIIEQISSEQIYHIPRILYHWRAASGSTALHGSEKPYTIIAAETAVSEYLTRQNIAADVTESTLLLGAIRVKYQLPEKLPLVSIIIPTYNGIDLLQRCIDGLLHNTDYQNIEILIINNNSDDPATLAYMQQLQTDGQARILDYTQPFNYPALNNFAVEHAKGELICLLNNDIEIISADWLTEMVSHAIRPEIGAVGAKLWYPDNRLQHGGIITGLGGIAGHSHKYLAKEHVGYFGRIALTQNLSAVTAACLVMRKETYLHVNGLDAENLAVAFNDVDFCLRIKESGLRILWTPYAELYHHESASRGQENTPEKVVRFQTECVYMKSRWGEGLLKDFAYSPNLTLDTEDFAYAWPPRVSSISS
ncbi:glycosyltransferase [Candidatus Halobeggiatoa sp. HSG11]|nr:glycosyltransferase [Candidatus Halobeggiatoa sp. HSG11]